MGANASMEKSAILRKEKRLAREIAATATKIYSVFICALNGDWLLKGKPDTEVLERMGSLFLSVFDFQRLHTFF
jgi:hypothetical protein